jgi:hypothetical protein
MAKTNTDGLTKDEVLMQKSSVWENIYLEQSLSERVEANQKKYYWADIKKGPWGISSTMSIPEYANAFNRLQDCFFNLKDYKDLLQERNTAYYKMYQIYIKTGLTKAEASHKALQDAVDTISQLLSDDKNKVKLFEYYEDALEHLKYFSSTQGYSELEANNAGIRIELFVSKANVKDELKEMGLIWDEKNPGEQGTGECKRLTIEVQNKITQKINNVVPSVQEKIESGTPTSSFESSVSNAKDKQTLLISQQIAGISTSSVEDSSQNTSASSQNTSTSSTSAQANSNSSTTSNAVTAVTGTIAPQEELQINTTTLSNTIQATSNSFLQEYKKQLDNENEFYDSLAAADKNHPGLDKSVTRLIRNEGYMIANDEQVQNKEDYLAAQKAISEAKTEMFQQGLGCATNIASNAINLAFQGTAAWAQCKSLYSKEGLKEIWEDIQDATWGTLKSYGKQKVSDLQQEMIQLPIEATSYAVSRITYYTSYFTTEIMKEVNLSKLMTPVEITRTSKEETTKMQEKQKTVEKSLENVQSNISKINEEVNKISGFIANGMSYVVEAPTILIKYLDNIMDMGFSYTDKYYDLAIEGAEKIIYKEIDISSKAIGNFAAARIVAPIKVQMQDTMSQISIMKAKSIVKSAASIATSISKIAAKLGL